MSEIVAVKSETTSVDYRTVFDSILELDITDCAVTVCLASVAKNETLPKFERLKMTEELAGEFRNIIKNHIKEHQKDWKQGELPFPDFIAESIPLPDEIEHFNISEYNYILEQLIPLQTLTEVDVFEEDEHFVFGLRFYVIIAQPLDGDPVYFFRSHSAKKVLSQSRGLAIWKSRGSYDRVKTPIFFLDEDIDCMSRSGMMFVLDKPSFEKIFRFFVEIQKKAHLTLSTIKQFIPIHNFEEFERDCERHLWKLRKLGNMTEKPYLHRITIDHIKATINKHQLFVRIVEVGGQELIVYDPKDKWVLLRLLDDDYLWSTLTEQGYEVNGKRELRQ